MRGFLSGRVTATIESPNEYHGNNECRCEVSKGRNWPYEAEVKLIPHGHGFYYAESEIAKMLRLRINDKNLPVTYNRSTKTRARLRYVK